MSNAPTPITIEAYLSFTHPSFEIAVSALMEMKSLKQLILFEYSHRLERAPEINTARDILIEQNMKVLEAVWQACPQYDQWLYAKNAGMYVKCTTIKEQRTITVATDTNPVPMVSFIYTLKEQ